MTSTTLRTPTQISDRPTGTSSAPTPGGPRRPRRRVAIVGVVVAGTLVAVAAVGTGVELGQRATSPAVPAVGRAVSYPPDWQAYRAGERGDVVLTPRPSDRTTYRAGERATGSTAPAGVTFPPGWQEYRAGERGDVVLAPRPSDWTTYRAGEH